MCNWVFTLSWDHQTWNYFKSVLKLHFLYILCSVKDASRAHDPYADCDCKFHYYYYHKNRTECSGNVLPAYKEPEKAPITPETYDCEDKCPCTSENLGNGHFYFSHEEVQNYIQCSEYLICYERSCPYGMIWQQSVLNCVRGKAPKTTQAPTTPKDGKRQRYNCDTKCPCTSENAAQGLFYFPHEEDEMFVQCSEHGQCLHKTCPYGTIWNQSVLTCVRGKPRKSTPKAQWMKMIK